jgi:hypothetical protein
MVALTEAAISAYIRSINIVIVHSDSPNQTTPRTTARFPALPNLGVCELYEQSSYNNFLEDGLVGMIHSIATSKPKFHLFPPILSRKRKELCLPHMAKILNLGHLKESKKPLSGGQGISCSVYG